jgi:hypothetical protein
MSKRVIHIERRIKDNKATQQQTQTTTKQKELTLLNNKNSMNFKR